MIIAPYFFSSFINYASRRRNTRNMYMIFISDECVGCFFLQSGRHCQFAGSGVIRGVFAHLDRNVFHLLEETDSIDFDPTSSEK